MGVYALLGFHCYITSIGFTTQEKLKHMYDRFGYSPFGEKSVFSEWCKNICLPRSIPSRISHELNLKTNDPTEFETIRKERGEKSMPDGIFEQSVEIYTEAFYE